MMLSEVVATTEEVSATSSRLAKVDTLARLLARSGPDEVASLVGLLLASPRQGRLGVGWRGLTAIEIAHADDPTLTVGDVNALAATSGSGSTAARTSILVELASRATAAEWDFLVRAMLSELRTGALSGVLLDAVARAADRPPTTVRRAAMLSGDLGETARVALTGSEGDLEAIGLQVGRPVLPMLASTAATPSTALEVTGPASVEYKLDGARIQVHRHGDEVGVYTRSLADITHRVPELVEIVRALPVNDVILDGETLSLDEDGGPRSFQETMSRFGAEVSRELVLRPWFFDVLHVEGRDLIDEPLSTRIDELERLAHPRDRDRRSRRRRAAVARRPRRRARGHRGQGDRCTLRRRPPREILGQGQTRPDLRPGGSGRGVGLRPSWRMALEPAPGRARPHRRVRRA